MITAKQAMWRKILSKQKRCKLQQYTGYEFEETWIWYPFVDSFLPSFEMPSLVHVIINFEEKLRWTKSESACICFAWLTSFTYFTGRKGGPPRTRILLIYKIFNFIFVKYIFSLHQKEAELGFGLVNDSFVFCLLIFSQLFNDLSLVVSVIVIKCNIRT